MSPAPTSAGSPPSGVTVIRPDNEVDDLVLVLNPVRRSRRALPDACRLVAVHPHLDAVCRHGIAGRLFQRTPVFELGVGGLGKDCGGHRVHSRGFLGKGSEIGSGATRLLPSASKRSRPRSVRSSQSHSPVVVRSAATCGDRRAPHHAVAGRAGHHGALDRAVVGEQRAEDRQVVGGVVDGRRPRAPKAEALEPGSSSSMRSRAFW